MLKWIRMELKELRKDIASLAGQAPVVVKAKMSVSNFKLRQGMPVGVKVTLRGNNMWEFLLRLIAIALPNIRDFQRCTFQVGWAWKLHSWDS